MSNERGFSGDAGGHGQTSTTTPSGGKGGSAKQVQTVVPVTTRLVRSSIKDDGESDGLTIGDTTYNLLMVVGKVVDIRKSSVFIVYTIEDDEGCIEALRRVEDLNGRERKSINDLEHVDCRVFGRLRRKFYEKRSKVFIVLKISPIQNLNEVTSHSQEVEIFAKKIELATNGKPTSTYSTNDNGNGGLDVSSLDTNHSKAPLSEEQKQVLEVIQKSRYPGVHVTDYFEDEIPQAQINNILEVLLREGHIYFTIDGFHFLSTAPVKMRSYYLF